MDGEEAIARRTGSPARGRRSHPLFTPRPRRHREATMKQTRSSGDVDKSIVCGTYLLAIKPPDGQVNIMAVSPPSTPRIWGEEPSSPFVAEVYGIWKHDFRAYSTDNDRVRSSC